LRPLPDRCRILFLIAALSLPAVMVACAHNPNSPSCTIVVTGAPGTPLAAPPAQVTLSVTAPSSCSWTASTTGSFLSIAGASSGTGNGTVSVNVQENNGPGRQGVVRVETQTVVINQDSGSPCTLGVSPVDVHINGQKQDVQVNVSAPAGQNCGWLAASNASFITIKEGASGTGSGRVVLSVPQNDGLLRAGTVTIAGRMVELVQDSTQPMPVPCEFVASPNHIVAQAAGIPSLVISVTATVGTPPCPWTAHLVSPTFLSFLGQDSGTDNGSITISIPPNAGAYRTTTIILNNPSHDFVQVAQMPVPDPLCVFAVSPTTIAAPAAGGSFTITVSNTQGGSCAWSAEAQSAFLSVTGPFALIGSGPTTVAVAANSGAARTGTFLIAGKTVTVNQSASGSSASVAGGRR
jgi:hypothetical protein